MLSRARLIREEISGMTYCGIYRDSGSIGKKNPTSDRNGGDKKRVGNHVICRVRM